MELGLFVSRLGTNSRGGGWDVGGDGGACICGDLSSWGGGAFVETCQVDDVIPLKGRHSSGPLCLGKWFRALLIRIEEFHTKCFPGPLLGLLCGFRGWGEEAYRGLVTSTLEDSSFTLHNLGGTSEQYLPKSHACEPP